jgi:hypothetical protein
VLLGAVVLATAAGAQAPPLAVARFFQLETERHSLGEFAGATSSTRAQIQTRSHKTIGASYTSCIQLAKGIRNCYATYVLPEGTMAAQGIVGSASRFSLTIVGGTGVYIAVHGWVTITGIGSSRFSELIFHLKQL